MLWQRTGLLRLTDKELALPKRLKDSKKFSPCPVADGGELFPNGIFVFNITKIQEFIRDNPADIPLEDVAVSGFFKSGTSINEAWLQLTFWVPQQNL